MTPNIPNVGTWLDALKQHSIFSLSDSELDEWRHWQNSSLEHVETTNKLPAAMAIRDGDLFVAVGSTIRALNLNQFKNLWVKTIQEGSRFADWIHQFPYKVLDTPEIKYRIVSLQLNGNGRLLAAAGERELTAVVLPRSGLRSTRLEHDADEGEHIEKLSCKTLTVGRYYHGRHPTNQVLKMLWHPLSESKTHLLVLASDSILRMFDLAKDLDEPEQLFDLSPAVNRFISKPAKKFSYSAADIADDREDAVSFCFGDSNETTNGWEAFSIFYVLRNGHIYVLCPVLPYKSIVRRKHLEILAGLISIKLRHVQEIASEQDPTSSQAQINLYRKQGIWIREAFQSANQHTTPSTLDSISDVDLRFMDEELVMIERQYHTELGELSRQGPFIITPQSQVPDYIDASDICFLNTEPVGVVIVTYENGQVNQFLQIERVDATWSPSADEGEDTAQHIEYELPRVSLYETLDLGVTGKTEGQGLSIIPDTMYSDVYYVYHKAGVHAVSIGGWIDSLKDIKLKMEFEDGNGDLAFKNWPSKSIPSEVVCVVDSAPLPNSSVPIVGVLSITDTYLSYSLLIVTATLRLIGLELSLRTTSAGRSQSATSAAISAQLATASEDSEDKYTPLLSLPPFEPPKALQRQQGLPAKPRVVVPPEYGGKKELIINEDTLKFLGDSAEVFRTDIREILKGAGEVRNRLQLQQKEQQRQLVQLYEIYKRINELSSPTEQEKRIKALEKVARKDKKLSLRADSILQKLLDKSQPELSVYEKRWIEELQRLQKIVEGESGFRGRVKKLDKVIEHLKAKQAEQQVKSSAGIASSKDTKLSVSQQAEIQQAMEKQTQSLQQTRNRVNELEKKISTLSMN
ncbi:hypothetical protein VKS41_001666 [Umbelopsis sp. WA50703]